jgi:hypothetical protein
MTMMRGGDVKKKNSVQGMISWLVFCWKHTTVEGWTRRCCVALTWRAKCRITVCGMVTAIHNKYLWYVRKEKEIDLSSDGGAD